MARIIAAHTVASARAIEEIAAARRKPRPLHIIAYARWRTGRRAKLKARAKRAPNLAPAADGDTANTEDDQATTAWASIRLALRR